MTKQITCECGFVASGDNDEEVVANARAHLEDAHPDVRIDDHDLVAMAEEI